MKLEKHKEIEQAKQKRMGRFRLKRTRQSFFCVLTYDAARYDALDNIKLMN